MRISISSAGSANRTGFALRGMTLPFGRGCMLQPLDFVSARRKHELVERLVSVREIAVLGFDELRIDDVLTTGHHDGGRTLRSGVSVTTFSIAAGDPRHVRREHLTAL